MHFKSFVSMGVAAVLIAPTLITAANPELAYAKTNTKTSSKKISAKAKSVIAKIKAINPKKSNYVTRTKSAVNAYKKLSSKDKKMVYNYGTLKKHWTIVQNRKAKAVIVKIKAINPKKSDYVLKTKSALSAYNKLSKTDKKKVTNYSTLKKHWKNIQPYLKKVDAFNKSVATLSAKNFTTKSVALEKQYDNLDAITKAAVPSTTLKKLSYYSDVVSTKKMVFRTLAVTDPSTSTPTVDSTNGSVILNIINAYKKLSGGQQTLLRDLLDDNYDNEEPRLNRYLALEDVVKIAVGIEKKYSDLKPANTTKYAKDLVDLYKEYDATSAEPKKYMPHNNEIANIGNVYKQQIDDAKNFTEIIDQLDAGSILPINVIKTINDLAAYKVKGISDPNSSYPTVAPIDLADAQVVTAYNKYTPIPKIVERFSQLPLLKDVTSGSLSSSDVSNMADLLAQYKKLGANQKTIVQNLIPTKNDYLSEDKNISTAQAIDKSYESALKNKAKPSYFVDLLKVNSAYETATPEVKRFVVNVAKINAIPNLQEYKDAKTAVDNFTNAVNSIPSATDTTTANSAITAINGVVTQYNNIASKPSWLALVDKTVLKTYNEYAQVLEVLKLVANVPATVQNPYKAKQITNITSATKAYKKLGTSQKQIVDIKYPSFADLVADESNITAAQKIDSAYLKLKKSSSTYPKEAKTVYQTYDDASDDVKTYVVNKNKIKDLLTTFTSEQNIADTFEIIVNALSKKSKIADVESAVDYYNTYITTSPKVSSLVDKAVLKKYNDYAPVSNVVKLLSLIKESNVSSPSVTPTDVKYIQQSTIAYNELKTDPKMIIDDADRTKFPFLYDGKYITEAAAIDKAYEKVKPTDEKYELEILDVYYNLYDRAPAVVQKYVANKAELDKIGTRYAPQLTIARDFETMVRRMSHISEAGSTPTVSDVRDLEEYYENKVKYNTINAKYNVALQTLIDPEVMATYNKYLPILQIQDIAKSMYVQYGKLFNEENVNLDKIKDTFYNKVKASYPIVGYTDSGKWDGNPIKVTNPNDIQGIYKAIDYYNQLETPQRAILEKAPASLGDRYYEEKYGITYTGNHVEKDVIRPSIPLSDGEIKNFLKAQEFDKEFEALSPSNKSYIQQAIALYYKFDKAGKPVQIYAIHEKEILAFKNNYNTDKLIAGIDNFISAVNKLSNDSLLTDIVDGVDGVVDQYNKLNEAQLSVIDKGVLTKYNVYAPIADIIALTPSVPASGSAYRNTDIDAMLKAITIYKKLTKDPKAIINVKNDPYKYLTQEADIKAAQKVDKAFKVLDKTDDKYVTNLKKVIQDYDALSDTAKGYVTSKAAIDAAKKNAVYKTPSDAAKAFEELIVGTSENDQNAWLNMYTVPYNKIKEAVDRYESLSSKAKSLVDSDVMKIYNKYSPIVMIVEALKNITPADINALTEDASTGYYKTHYPKRDIGTEILNAIQLYNKLGSDQKDIVLNKVQPAKPGDPIPATNPLDTTDDPLGKKKLALLNETNNIKAAQALDKKITAIKPKSSSYVKGIIDAQKTLNVMPKEQRVYLQNTDILDGYDKTGSQTAKAIDDLAKFENGVKQVEQWTSEIQKDASGAITGTCSNTSDTCDKAITKQMNDLKNLFTQLNTTRLVDGSEISLAPLIDKTILTRYQYFRAIYDVIDELEK